MPPPLTRSLGKEGSNDRYEVSTRLETLKTLREFLKLPRILVTPPEMDQGTPMCLPNRVYLSVQPLKIGSHLWAEFRFGPLPKVSNGELHQKVMASLGVSRRPESSGAKPLKSICISREPFTESVCDFCIEAAGIGGRIGGQLLSLLNT